MANLCIISYVIEGKKKEVQDLFHKLNGLIANEDYLKKTDLGLCPLAKVVEIFGGDPKKIHCRGEINNLEIDKSGSLLYFNTETSRNGLPEVWDLVISQYNTLCYYFRAEECDMDYYVTNDIEGKHFPERYIADTWLYGLRYFEGIEEVCKHFEEITSVSVSGMEELEDKACDFNSNDEGKFFYIHQFEIINIYEYETAKSFFNQQSSY